MYSCHSKEEPNFLHSSGSGSVNTKTLQRTCISMPNSLECSRAFAQWHIQEGPWSSHAPMLLKRPRMHERQCLYFVCAASFCDQNKGCPVMAQICFSHELQGSFIGPWCVWKTIKEQFFAKQGWSHTSWQSWAFSNPESPVTWLFWIRFRTLKRVITPTC